MWQKPTQPCEAIIPQFKISIFLKVYGPFNQIYAKLRGIMSIKEKSEYRKKPSHGIYKTEVGCIFKCLKLLRRKIFNLNISKV